MKKISIIFALVVILILGSFLLGLYKGSKQDEEEISTQSILKSIEEQSFLVTKTLYLDEEIKVKTNDSSGWRGLLLGDEINARGITRVDIGVDLKKLNLEDISLDKGKKTISINLPKATILDSSLYGDLDIENKKGIWTSVTDFLLEEEEQDFNDAIKTITDQAVVSARSQEEIFKEAQLDTAKLLKTIVSNIANDYGVIVSPK